MILYVYNRQMALLGVVEAISSLIWIRNYWGCGEFKLLVPAIPEHVELLKPGNLVMRQFDNEPAQIQDIYVRQDSEGMEALECHGKFLLRWLGQRVIAQPLTMVESYDAILEQLVWENAVSPANTLRILPGLGIFSTGAVRDPVDYTAQIYQNLQTALEEGAKASKLGLRILAADPGVTQDNLFLFQVYDGADRRRGNAAGNKPCVFSVSMDNVIQQEYSHSIDGYRSTAYVEGAKDANEIIPMEEVGSEAFGLDRHEMHLSATDIKWTVGEGEDEVTLTEAEYRALMIQRGTEELARAVKNMTFESEINPRSNLVYRQDYDLGDRVTCENQDWNLTIDVRITQITETYQPGTVEIRAVFGESAPTLLDQVRRVAKELL